MLIWSRAGWTPAPERRRQGDTKVKELGWRLDRRRLLAAGGMALLTLGGLAACDVGQENDNEKKSGEVESTRQVAQRAGAGRAPS